MLAIRLPEEIEQRLDFLAKETGRTKTFYAREAILTYLEDLEDYYLAQKTLTDFKNSGEKAIPLEKVLSDYGMDN